MEIEKKEIVDRNSFVYDIETIKSCFTYTAINIDTEEIVKYVIHKDLNQLNQLIAHLKSCKGQIGFNNINFDYPIIHYILKNYKKWETITTQEIINLIYNKAQELINNQNNTGYYGSIKEKDVLIPQLDLFKVWHYDNKARMTSLKSLEISMNYPNVLDMPIDHTKEDVELNDINKILEYNSNDVLATYEFYKKSIDKINLRKQIQKKYGIPCINYSDSKIGESLILNLYATQNNLNIWDVKKLRTYRNDGIVVKDIIFDYIKFDSKEFNELLLDLNKTIIKNTKGDFNKSVIYKGFEYVYGSGGIHGCIKSGVYESDNDYIIIDCDVASLYPNVAIKNRLYIEHLGESFIDLYDKDIIQERLRAKKAKEMSISDALKLSANSVYGKSNDQYSFLYDPKYTMATTINGQLLLTMLAEKFVNRISDLTMIQVNTDGITVKIPKKYESLYYNICMEWENITNLQLEYVEYAKMVIRDVNNYSSQSMNEVELKEGCIVKKLKESFKFKGVFEYDKVVGTEPAYHKDNSFRVVPLALFNYFMKGIAIEDTIFNHTNVYDFCGRQKFGRDSHGEIHYLESKQSIIYDEALEIFNKQGWVDYYNDTVILQSWIDDKKPYEEMAVDKNYVIESIIKKSKTSTVKIEKQQKNVRYYISKSGKVFVKQYTKGSSELINKGYQVEIFNKYIEKNIKDYNIDYQFYVKEAYKIINIIEDKQLELF